MKSILIAIALATGISFVSTSPASAATRNYDCSKPGNANKTICKSGTTAAVAKAAPAARAARTTTSLTKSRTATRNYDCTKAGNKNKVVCRTAASQVPAGKAAGSVKTNTSTTAAITDCTKWYNKARAQCRTTTSASPARTTASPAPKSPVNTTNSVGTNQKSSGSSVNSNAAGATAQCKDGSFSHSKTHQGSCSRHGGVAKWM